MSDLKGTNIAAPVVPFTSEDKYPTAYNEHIKGGFKYFNSVEERDSFPVERLADGKTICYVDETDTWYKFKNNQWSAIEFVKADLKNIRIDNNLDSRNVSASKGEACFLKFTFISQERSSEDLPFEDTGERGFCQILVRDATSEEFIVVKEMTINSNEVITVDVSEYLKDGGNYVSIKATGEITGVETPSLTYSVQLTSLAISAVNFRWWLAFTGDISVPFNISGNVSKNLHVSVTGEGYKETYVQPLGTNIYVETAYNYTVPSPGISGVYKLSAYVSTADDLIKTQSIEFNIMCPVEGEQVKLIAINNVVIKANNWQENALFDYSIYDGDAVNSSALFTVKKEYDTVYESDEDAITTQSKNTLSFPMEIETIDNSDFSIVVSISDINGKLCDDITIPVSNMFGFAAVAGAVFYLNPKTRSNNQANRLNIINEIDKSEIKGIWTAMNWGNDGWVDDNGFKVLRIMACSKLEIDYQPFAQEAARYGKTIEVDFKISNVTDYNFPVINMSAANSDNFIGLQIFADNILMHSQVLKNDEVQSLHIFEEKRTHLTLTIIPDAYGYYGLNLCILYINGVKNREFVYENNDYFAHSGNIIIGSDYADVDIYGIRVYESGLTSFAVLTNFINWQANTDDKNKTKSDNDILDLNGVEVDFENTKDQYNVFVFDKKIPQLADQTERVGTLEVFFKDNPEWNVSISNVTAKGQGTSSMRYWIWNTRFQLDKKSSIVTHPDGSQDFYKWAMTPFLPAGQKFTAKKNYASSMQSHKIGAVNSYTDLVRTAGLSNEAMQIDDKVRVSVWEAPFIGFEKQISEDGIVSYAFRGLFTFGPDKGDKYTFGYDTDAFPKLMSIEGSDNSPLLTLFRVPWNPSKGLVVYNEDEEAWQYNGANSFDYGEGEFENISTFIPAYNCVYICSPRLKPFNGTLADLNERVSEFKNEPYEFWSSAEGEEKYNVYYYEASESKFVASDIGDGQINLYSQLVNMGYGLSDVDLSGKSETEINNLFINARIQKFRKEAPDFWEINDCLFFMNNVEFHAGTDERAKNTYPYCFNAEGSKWRWRVDDADTRFDTTNRGLPDKGYWVEVHDVDETGAQIWNGETNNFFNLMELAFPDEKIISMRNMMATMETLGGLSKGNDLEKMYAFYQKYYFDNAQDYFPENAYNSDAKYCYEMGKVAYMDGRYTNDTDPITQSLGDHYLAEQRWITKRILYMMSKYSFGLFSANGDDIIVVRAAGNSINYDITPAMDMYPAISNGTTIIRGERTKAGEVCHMEIELSGTGDQQNAIQAASYLQDIGDWYNKNVQGSMIVKGRMLRELRLGHKTEPITITISSLTISDCESLQKLVLSRIATLTGTLNLLSCTHLREVYIDGTSITQLRLPEGGGLKLIEFNDLSQYLVLKNYPQLESSGIILNGSKTVLTDFFVSDCPKLGPMQLLLDIIEAQSSQGENHALKRIRAVGFNETFTSKALDVLAQIADGSYVGLDSEGVAGSEPVPVLDGTLNIDSSVYQDTIEVLNSTFKKLVINVLGGYYLRFADAEAARLCINTWGDGNGVTKEQLATVTKLSSTPFSGNTVIETFDELQYFSNLETLSQSFNNCSNLRKITIPKSVKYISGNLCRGTKVTDIGTDLSHAVSLTGQAFWYVPLEGDYDLVNCTELDHFFTGSNINSVKLYNLKTIGIETFYRCGLVTYINIPKAIESIGSTAFYECKNLEMDYVFPESLRSIGNSAFRSCTKMKSFKFTSLTPPSLGTNVFDGTSCPIYVPNEALQTYKTATNWSSYASRIIGY